MPCDCLYTRKRMSLRIAMIAAAALVLALLYGYGLGSTGLLGPDEPRYADIGRAMWQSGDFVTPRLFGEAWYEKPAMLYWLVAAGFALGADDSLAPRLLIPFLGIGFLLFYFWQLRRRCGDRAAWAAAAILASCAGYLGFSHAAVTDLPLTVFFGAGMLLAMDWALEGDRRLLPWAAACFALASLAKGLVPLVLAAPLLLFGYRRVLDWLRPAPLGAFAFVALPWYALCTWQNGWPFIDEFFLEHHWGRFFLEDLQHVQPGWFYLPVAAALLLPWTPLLALLAGAGLRGYRAFWQDRRVLYFAAWAVFGLLFFSASTNKLPGYLLPLLPAFAAWMGLALARVERARVVLACVALLASLFALAGGILPEALASGLRRTTIDSIPWAMALPSLSAAIAVFWLEHQGKRRLALGLLVSLIALNLTLLKREAIPLIASQTSAVAVWQQYAGQADQLCIAQVHRATEYGLRYYSRGRIPLCADEARPLQLREDGQRRVIAVPAEMEDSEDESQP
jgi:4-amino-4-deoxy-L-arabinose transferase-like glycosyltransferase